MADSSAEMCGRIDLAIKTVLNKIPGITSLKSEQLHALKAFLQGRDVFGFLPTGFGKSLIYQLAPLVLEEMGHEKPIIIVVSPLVALMEDQVKEAAKFGVTAMQLGVHCDSDILNGKCSLVFGSPEAWLTTEKWRNMLGSKPYKDRICGVVVDEVHVTYKWGEGTKHEPAFREAYGRLADLRALTKPGTPVLALTTSANLDSRRHVMEKLHMETVTEVIASPSRNNIRLGICEVPATTNFKCLDWVVKDVASKGPAMAPIIIYCRTLKSVGHVFGYLKAELGVSAWVNGQDQKANNLLIGIYHSKTLDKNKARVLASLNGDGNCRVIVATTALGMGLNFGNISHVVMFGAPEDAEDIVQQVGRAGRDRSNAYAILYVKKQNMKIDQTVRELLKSSTKGCFRKHLYGYFDQKGTNIEPGHSCCTYCHSTCTCGSGGCAVPLPNYETLPSTTPSKCRNVEPSDRAMIRDMLEEYRATLVQDSAHLYTNTSVCTGFSAELVNAVVEKCEYIFDLAYIMDNVPVFTLKHARQILQVICEVFDDVVIDQPHYEAECFSEVDLDFMGYFDEDDVVEDDVPELTSDSESDNDDDVPELTSDSESDT